MNPAHTAGTTAFVKPLADDLNAMTGSLARGIGELEHVEHALAHPPKALTEMAGTPSTAVAAEQKTTIRALYDAATGLPNRMLFDDRLAQGIAIAERHGGSLAVMSIDLDHFKTLDDEHGHAVGDKVLLEVSRRLSANCRDQDTICRNGEHEFLYLFMSLKGPANVDRLAGALQNSIARPMAFDGREFTVGSSVGIALYPNDGITGDQLVKNADAAMYRSTKEHRGQGLNAMISSTSAAA